VLHRNVGPAVDDAALDLRPAELGVTVPLVACLLALSAWPAAISGHSFTGTGGTVIQARAQSQSTSATGEAVP